MIFRRKLDPPEQAPRGDQGRRETAELFGAPVLADLTPDALRGRIDGLGITTDAPLVTGDRGLTASNLTCDDAVAARQFLLELPLVAPGSVVIVRTPDGVLGADVLGLFVSTTRARTFGGTALDRTQTGSNPRTR